VGFTGCSPKIKLALWTKTHKEGVVSLKHMVLINPVLGLELVDMACTDRQGLKKKIIDALNDTDRTHQAGDPFVIWCQHNRKTAKGLRRHARAICKLGLHSLADDMYIFSNTGIK